jgi:hypothetical protein
MFPVSATEIKAYKRAKSRKSKFKITYNTPNFKLRLIAVAKGLLYANNEGKENRDFGR